MRQSKRFVVGMDDDDYPVAPEKRGLIRVVDESGEDCLYPKIFFRSIALPQDGKKAVLAAA
jgi:hypothetical protein